ncbi:MAG: cation:proton antiporter [Rubrobacter sp.]|nr:cation:proton antiporter [Rubrobacter sp.]
MPEISLTGVLVVAAVAFAVPLVLGLLPSVRLPSVVVEIVAGVVLGPAVLGLVDVDLPLRVLALIGLAFLLFLAGSEIDLERLRGGRLRGAAVGFALSAVLALGVAFALRAGGLIEAPLFVAIMLSATALGIVVPVLADAGELGSTLGQQVIAAASVADFAAVILLSLFFSGEAGSVGATLLLLGGFVLLVVAIVVALAGAGHSIRLRSALQRLQDTSAQIRVRGAFLLLVGFAVLAQVLGLEVILGAFIAGAVLRLIDREGAMTHPLFRAKLEAVGFGVFIPFFFVTSGMELDLGALFGGGLASLAPVPVFLLALLLVRGLTAVLYFSSAGARGTVAAGLLQATSLPFLVAAADIGVELGELSPASGAALVLAGLLSVLLFPLAALVLLRSGGTPIPQRE